MLHMQFCSYLSKFPLQLLMDGTKREIYNKFGAAHIDFDPRSEEIKILGKMMFSYVFWGACAYVMTLSKSAGSTRVWIAIVCVGILIGESVLLFSETPLSPLAQMPWKPLARVTEAELIAMVQLLLPAVLVCFKVLGDYFFIDIDAATTISLLKLSAGFQVQ